MKENIKARIDAAQDAGKTDLVIQNGTVVDVFSLDTIRADVAIKDGVIAGIGSYPEAPNVIDAAGQFIVPGFIDGHIHIESTMVTPAEFSRALLRHGVTSVVTDPHEIANVAGAAGIQFMIDEAKKAQIDIFMKLPSCVPATPFEQNGATLSATDLAPFLEENSVIGLAEVMDFPAVLQGNDAMLQKIELALQAGLTVDGHAAGLPETALNVYAAAGIRNDHEAVSAEEALSRVQRGMHVLVREGSAAKDLAAILPAVTERNSTRFSLCTDDKHLDELAEHGTVNSAAKKAVAAGLDPLIAIQMATINNAVCHQLPNRGAVAPGYVADLLLLPDLHEMQPSRVLKNGRIVTPAPAQPVQLPSALQNTVRIKPLTKEALRIPVPSSKKARVIGVVPGRIITEPLIETVQTENGAFVTSRANDHVKMAVCERHRATGSVGVGIVKGLGLKRGAIASTVAHDSHNLVIAGTNDDDMIIAAQEAERIGGGLVIVVDGDVLSSLPLAAGGIMSDRSFEEVVAQLHHLHDQLNRVADQQHNIFMALSFLCLPVIPHLKLTDRGLFDVDRFEHVSVGVKY